MPAVTRRVMTAREKREAFLKLVDKVLARFQLPIPKPVVNAVLARAVREETIEGQLTDLINALDDFAEVADAIRTGDAEKLAETQKQLFDAGT